MHADIQNDVDELKVLLNAAFAQASALAIETQASEHLMLQQYAKDMVARTGRLKPGEDMLRLYEPVLARMMGLSDFDFLGMIDPEDAKKRVDQAKADLKKAIYSMQDRAMTLAEEKQAQSMMTMFDIATQMGIGSPGQLPVDKNLFRQLHRLLSAEHILQQFKMRR